MKKIVLVAVCLLFGFEALKASAQSNVAPRPIGSAASSAVRDNHADDTVLSEIEKNDQASTSNQSSAQRVRKRIESIGLAGRVTVVLNNGNEYYGAVSQISDESFQLADIDLKQQVTISYADVRKIRRGFGNPNPFNGKRWHPGWHIAAALAAVGLTIVVFVAAGTATR
jgi:hypothetical protein